MLVAVVLSIDRSGRYIGSYSAPTRVSSGCTGAGTLSQTKFHRPESSGCPIQRKQSLYFCKPISRWPAFRFIEAVLPSETYCQGLSEIVRNSQKLKQTALLKEQHPISILPLSNKQPSLISSTRKIEGSKKGRYAHTSTQCGHIFENTPRLPGIWAQCY